METLHQYKAATADSGTILGAEVLKFKLVVNLNGDIRSVCGTEAVWGRQGSALRSREVPCLQ